MAATPRLADCALLVAISAHYVEARNGFLLDVVRSLADLPVARLDLRVIVNDIDDMTLARHRRLLGAGLGEDASLLVERCGPLEHPFHLTWAHKRLIPECFLAPGSAWTHFLYLEDDMRFGAANLAYFLRARDLLRPHGLLPGFARVEYSRAAQELRFVDPRAPLRPATLRRLHLDGTLFLSPPRPYCALYLLDRELAEEHVASRSFDRDRSAEVMHWDVRERAAAGLCWESPPHGHRTRYVLPFDEARQTFAACCWVPHLANTYVARPHTKLATIPVDQIVEP